MVITLLFVVIHGTAAVIFNNELAENMKTILFREFWMFVGAINYGFCHTCTSKTSSPVFNAFLEPSVVSSLH